MNDFFRKIETNFKSRGTCLCVGLDPDPLRIPERYKSSTTPIYDFLADIVNATSDLVCSYKPNMAFFESAGPEGLIQLAKLIEHIRNVDPEIPIILDAKRGDIGNTAKHYATTIFDTYSADGTTVNPYMGADTLESFTDRQEKGVFVLCLTSNPGYIDFENLSVKGDPLFIHVARKMAEINRNENIALVVGATHPAEAEKIRNIAPDLPFLMPGIGAQGGDPAMIMKIGKTASGLPPIVNSSRSILYPKDATTASTREAALKTRDLLNKYINS
ncbi:orotidine-5'-phosphate decarboxylase [bacterium]|nr:orotidine-5'-phosphate decarboxylase [bacterium]